MTIAKELVQERKKQSIFTNLITKLESEVDTGKKLDKGVFIYQNESLLSLVFDKYDTMADAVKAAALLVNAIILYNGKEVIYDILSNRDAYYIDNDTNKVMLIEIWVTYKLWRKESIIYYGIQYSSECHNIYLKVVWNIIFNNLLMIEIRNKHL